MIQKKIVEIVNKHGPEGVFFVWAIGGLFAFGVATTDVVHSQLFVELRILLGRIIPTVVHPPSPDVLDPLIASSFLALIWATSPVLLLFFWNIPPEKLLSRTTWLSPLSGKAILAVGVMIICALMAITYHWDSRRLGNVVVAHPLGFVLIASLVAALPWYTLAFTRAWWQRVNESSKEGEE